MGTSTSNGPPRIAVIGGDGIGPEVIAEALGVLDAAGAKLDTVEFDLGGQRYLRDGEILSDETLEELRGFDAILLGAVGTPEVPPGVIERGLLLKLRFTLDLYINQRPFVGPNHEFVVIRENTEGPVRRRGRGAAQGHAARGRHAGEREHADGRRALHPLRLRVGPVTAAAPPHARAQDERAAVLRRPVAAHVRRRRRRVSRHRDGVPPRRRGDDLLRPGSAALRRHRHRQPVRRHPHRPRRRRVGRRRAGQLGEPQPGAHRAEPVRAGPRVGARHRRHRPRPTRSRRSCRRP